MCFEGFFFIIIFKLYWTTVQRTKNKRRTTGICFCSLWFSFNEGKLSVLWWLFLLIAPFCMPRFQTVKFVYLLKTPSVKHPRFGNSQTRWPKCRERKKCCGNSDCHFIELLWVIGSVNLVLCTFSHLATSTTESKCMVSCKAKVVRGLPRVRLLWKGSITANTKAVNGGISVYWCYNTEQVRLK